MSIDDAIRGLEQGVLGSEKELDDWRQGLDFEIDEIAMGSRYWISRALEAWAGVDE